jgi:hypothetical protein
MTFPTLSINPRARWLRVLFALGVVALLLLAALLVVARVEFARHRERLAPLLAGSLSRTLGRAVHVDGISLQGVNAVKITGISVARGADFSHGTALTLPDTTAYVNLLTFLRHRDPVGAISAVTLRQPTLAVARDARGRWDFQDVVDKLTAPSPTAGAPLRPRLTVREGRVQVRDPRLGVNAYDLVDVDAGLRPGWRADTLAFRLAGRDRGNRMGRVEIAGRYVGTRGAESMNVDVRADKIVVKTLTRFLPKRIPIIFENGTAALRVSALFTSLPSLKGPRPLSADAVTATVDIAGVGLRLQEMTVPVVAESGLLRLTHDRARYPQGSRLELIDVRAKAGAVPVTLEGGIRGINLFDLRHLDPEMDLRLQMNARDAADVRALFAPHEWPAGVTVTGPAALNATFTGRTHDLRIDGTLTGDRLAVSGVAGQGMKMDFHLRPGQHPASADSVRLTTQLVQAQVGTLSMHGLTLVAGSATPWTALDSDPRVRGVLTATQVRSGATNLGRVSADLAGTRGGVRLANVRSHLFGGVVHGSVQYPFGGAVRISGTAAGLDLAQLATAVRVSAPAGQGGGTFTATYAPNGGLAVAIADAHAETAYGRFTVKDGRYAAGRLALPVHGDGIPLAKFDDAMRGIAALDGTVSGSVAAPQLSARVTAADGAFQGRAFTAGSGEVAYGPGGLRLKDLRFTRPGLALTIPGGAEGFDPRAGFRNIDVALQADGAELDEVLALFGVKNPCPTTGPIRGGMTFRVTEAGLQASGEAQAARAVVHIPQARRTYPLDLTAVGMRFTIAGRTMTITDLHASRGATTVQVTGTAESGKGAPTSVELAYRGAGARLQDLPLDLFGIPVALGGPVEVSGTVRGVLNGSGPTPLDVRVTAAAPALMLEGAPAGVGDIALQYAYRPKDRVLTIERGRIAGDAFTLTSAGTYDLSARRLDGAWVDLADVHLPALRRMADGAESARFSAVTTLLALLPEALRGDARAHLTFEGSLTKPRMALDLGVTRLALGATPLPDVQGQLTSRETKGRYRLHVDTLTATSGDSRGTLSGEIDPKAQTLALQYAVQGLPAQTLAAWWPSLRVAGTVGADGTLAGPWAQPVLESDVRVDGPMVAGVTLARAVGHLSGTREVLALRGGQVWPATDAVPVAIAGTLGLNDDIDPTRMPLALTATVPSQSIVPWQRVWPGLRDMQGTVAGHVQVAGTVAAPRVTGGEVALAGAVTLPVANAHFPNRLADLDLRVRLAGNRVTLEALSATLDRAGSRPSDFQPGRVQAGGSVTIPDGALTTPARWTWDVQSRLDRAPLDPALTLVPRISGYARITGEGEPTITGVLFADHVKLRKPKVTAPPPAGDAGPGPAFNPRLSLVLQAGEGVRIAQGIFSVPLKPTPLPWPTADAGMAYNATMLNPGDRTERPGTWGVVTGSLYNPQVYGRFEVDGKKVAFPLSLFSGVRRARGHVTYSMATGAKVVMGIPDLPVQEAKR